MKVTRKQANWIEMAIAQWKHEELIDTDTASRLSKTIQRTGFDWKRLTKYAFWVAVACIAIAVSAVISDQWLEPVLQRVFGSIQRGYCLLFALLAILMFYLGQRRRRLKPQASYSSEAVLLLGVLSVAASISFLAADIQAQHFSWLLLLAAVVYALLGLWFPSTLVWVFSMIALGGWFGAETGYQSGWGAYYLGMNYPFRFVFFGAGLIALSFLFVPINWRARFSTPTRVMGLIYLFIALWILSIFGNYGDTESWYQASHGELLKWSLLFGLASVLAIYLGIRYGDKITRGFGLSFLFINLYTRFFEYFWSNMHKAVFFALLAVSFWYLGSRAERIWGIGQSSVQTQAAGVPTGEDS